MQFLGNLCIFVMFLMIIYVSYLNSMISLEFKNN